MDRMRFTYVHLQLMGEELRSNQLDRNDLWIQTHYQTLLLPVYASIRYVASYGYQIKLTRFAMYRYIILLCFHVKLNDNFSLETYPLATQTISFSSVLYIGTLSNSFMPSHCLQYKQTLVYPSSMLCFSDLYRVIRPIHPWHIFSSSRVISTTYVIKGNATNILHLLSPVENQIWRLASLRTASLL